MSFKNWKSSIVYGSVLKPVSLAVRLGMTNITSYHWLVGKLPKQPGQLKRPDAPVLNHLHF